MTGTIVHDTVIVFTDDNLPSIHGGEEGVLNLTDSVRYELSDVTTRT